MQRPARVYQILTMLIYGEYAWLDRYGDGVMEFKFRPLSLAIASRNDIIRKNLRWLKEKHFLAELEIYNGSCRLRLATPKKLFASFGYNYLDDKNSGEGI
jgi:hypothetical protein